MIGDNDLVELAKQATQPAGPLGQIYHFHPCGPGPSRPVSLFAAIALPGNRSPAQSVFFYLEFEILDSEGVWLKSGSTSMLLSPGETGTLSLYSNMTMATGKYMLRGRLSSIDLNDGVPKKLDLQECDFQVV